MVMIDDSPHQPFLSTLALHILYAVVTEGAHPLDVDITMEGGECAIPGVYMKSVCCRGLLCTAVGSAVSYR